MLRAVPAERTDIPDRSGIGAARVDHRRDRVHRIVVRRATGEPEPAGHRKRAIVAADAAAKSEGVPGDLDGCGEA